MTTTRNRIEQMLEEFMSAETVGRGLVREFREWLFGKGHEAEKQSVFRELMEFNICFEPNPGDDVYEAYKKIALKLGFGGMPVLRTTSGRSGCRAATWFGMSSQWRYL